MKQPLEIRRIAGGSLFKLLFIGHCLSLLPFCIFCGILSLTGAHTITVDRQYVTGIAGLIDSLWIGPLLTVLFTCFAWLALATGLWIYSKFRPLTLYYIPDDATPRLR